MNPIRWAARLVALALCAPTTALGQPDLADVHTAADVRYHAGLLDTHTRYALPSRAELARDERGLPDLWLTRFNRDSIPEVLARDADHAGGLQTRWRVVWPTGPHTLPVPVVWAGLRTTPAGSHLTWERSDPASFRADTPLDRTGLTLLWGDDRRAGIFAARGPRMFDARFVLVYSGRCRLERSLTVRVSATKLQAVVQELGGESGAIPFTESDAVRFVASAVNAGAVRIPGGLPSRAEALAVFSALRRTAFEYDFRPTAGGVLALVFRPRGLPTTKDWDVGVEQLAYQEAVHVLASDWPAPAMRADEHRREVAFRLDGVPATQRVVFHLPPDAEALGVREVRAEVMYSEPGRDYTRKGAVRLVPAAPEADWSFQIRYPLRAQLSYRLTVVAQAEGAVLRSGWIETSSGHPDWHFAVPEHHVLTGDVLRTLLVTETR